MLEHGPTQRYVQRSFMLIAKLVWEALQEANELRKEKKNEDAFIFKGIIEMSNLCNSECFLHDSQSFIKENYRYTL